MKIAIACLNLSWQSGGPRLIFSLAQELKKNGHQVVIYAPEFNGKYFKEFWSGLDIRVAVPKKPLVWSGRPQGLLAKILRKIGEERRRAEAARAIVREMEADFDVLNVHDFAYPVGYFYKKLNPKAKVIWTENDPPFMYLPKKSFLFDLLSRAYNFWKDFSSRKYFRAIDQVAVLDSYNEVWCIDRGLKPVIVRPGVDDKNFYAPVKDITPRARFKKVRLFGLGSLNEYRRYEDTIGALKYLRDWGYDASALIIASDMWDEKEYREKILGIVKENSLENFVAFNFQGVSEEGLKDAYRESDLFVYAVYLPPPRNGFGFSVGVFEAMAAGLPVILCRTTTSTEVLEDGKTALFVDPMSPEQIAEKVKTLVDDPGLYNRIAVSGQNFAKENLSWEKYANEMLAGV